MWLYFDENGTLKQQFQYYGPAFRTGSTDGEIFAVFENMDEADLADVTATLKLLKPISGRDAKIYAYYPITMNIATQKFDTDNFDTVPDDLEPFVNGQNYTGMKFSFNQSVDEDFLILLDTPGVWSAIITLFNANGSIAVKGRANFNVQNNGYDQNATLLPEDWSLDQIYDAIATKLSIKSAGYIKVVDLDNIADFVFDETRFNEDDIVFNIKNKMLYQIHDGVLTVLRNGKDFVGLYKHGLSIESGTPQPVHVLYTIPENKRYKHEYLHSDEIWGSKKVNKNTEYDVEGNSMSYKDFINALFVTQEGIDYGVEFNQITSADNTIENGKYFIFPDVGEHSLSTRLTFKAFISTIDDQVRELNFVNEILTLRDVGVDSTSHPFWPIRTGRIMFKFVSDYEEHVLQEVDATHPQPIYYWTGNMANRWLEAQITMYRPDDSVDYTVWIRLIPHRF